MLVGLFINQYPNLGCSLALFGSQPLLGYGHAYPTRTSKDKLKSGLTSSLVKKHKCLNWDALPKRLFVSTDKLA
jgi:hypothetical protein